MNYHFNHTKLRIILILCTVFFQLSYGNQNVKLQINTNIEYENPLLLAYTYGKEILLHDTLILELGINTYNLNLHSGVYHLITKGKILADFFVPDIVDDTIEFLSYGPDSLQFLKGPQITTDYYYRNIGNSTLTASIGDSMLNDTLYTDYLKLFENPVQIGQIKRSDFNKESDYLKVKTEYNILHYLDKVNFSNENLLYMPAFIGKLNFYLDKIVSKQHVNQYEAVDMILNRANSKQEMYNYLLIYFVEKYESKKNIPSYEFVYLNIIQNHLMKSKSALHNIQIYDNYLNDYNNRKPSSLGERAYNFEFKSKKGKLTELYDLKSNYTILYFNNFNCPMCSKVEKALNQFLITNKEEITVVSICLENDKRKWKKNLNKFSYDAWNYVLNDNSRFNLRHMYRIDYLPTLYLLDANKRIVMKKFTVKQLAAFLK